MVSEAFVRGALDEAIKQRKRMAWYQIFLKSWTDGWIEALRSVLECP